MEKTLLIVNKINQINSYILNNISLQTNVIPFYNSSQVSCSANKNNITQQTNIATPTMPEIYNTNTNHSNSNYEQKTLVEDFAIEWLKFRQSKCVYNKNDNPKPLSRKTLDNNRNSIKNHVLPFLKQNKILYLSQLSQDILEKLLISIESQNGKHKAYETLNLLFKYAIKKKKLLTNPLEFVDKPPESIKTGEEDDDYNFIEPYRQDIWLDKFEEEHKLNNNNANHIHRDIAILFAIMLLTGIRPEEACRTEMVFTK